MLGKLLLFAGGTLAVAISFGITMWMVAQPPGDLNLTHLIAMAATSSAGTLAVIGKDQPLRWGTVALVLLVLGLIPLLPWYSMLFWPSLLFMLLGVSREVIRHLSGRGA
jgi:hypothetical protein